MSEQITNKSCKAPSRRRELAAALDWTVRSWLRPADAEAIWEQRAGHGVGLFDNPEHEPLPSEATTNPAQKSSAGQGR